MLIGRSDDPQNPRRGEAKKGRSSVWARIAKPIWASGSRAAPTGRTHERHRTASEFFLRPALAPTRPSTHALPSARRVPRAEHCHPCIVDDLITVWQRISTPGAYLVQQAARRLLSHREACRGRPHSFNDGTRMNLTEG